MTGRRLFLIRATDRLSQKVGGAEVITGVSRAEEHDCLVLYAGTGYVWETVNRRWCSGARDNGYSGLHFYHLFR